MEPGKISALRALRAGHGGSNIAGPALKRFALLLCSRLASARSVIHSQIVSGTLTIESYFHLE